MAKPNAAKLLTNKLPKLRAALSRLASGEVLVGVPRENGPRDDKAPTNATLAYIHDNGAPAAGIPARPFMRPGVEANRKRIETTFRAAAKAALKVGNDGSAALEVVGMTTAASIKDVISQGLSPALKPGTIAGRARSRGTKSRRKGEKQYAADFASGVAAGLSSEQAAEQAQTNAGIKPLVNTGQLRNSITYVVRKKS